MIFAVIFVVIGLVVYAAASVATDDSDKHDVRIVAKVILGLAGLLVFLSCFVMIGTQDIGVRTSFGRPAGGLTNGIHFKAPWEKVVRLDNAIQTDTYASNGYNGDMQNNAQGGCVNVRIARQATACVNITIRWQIRKSTVDYLFRNYRNNDNIRNNLLHRDLQTAVNVAFAKYDPLGIDNAGNSTQATTATLSTQVQAELAGQVGNWIDVSKVFIPIFNFDPDTQSRLNQLQLQVAQTRIAIQAEKTAAAQAAANRALAASVSNDPGVLVSKCLDILAEAVQKGQALPAGFSCFGPSNAVAVANQQPAPAAK